MKRMTTLAIFVSLVLCVPAQEKKDNDLEGGTLGEVIVKKTRIKVFARGNTIIYNADAFNLPESSMRSSSKCLVPN